MNTIDILDRGRQIAALIDGADAAELKQLRAEWQSYRPNFFALAREAEARACIDLINAFQGVSDIIDLALIHERKGK